MPAQAFNLEIRPTTQDEFRTYLDTIALSFGETWRDEDVEPFREFTEHDRVLAAFDGDRLIGGTQIVSFEVALPGGTSVPCAGVTAVGVAPTHRRQGVLTQLMRRQLDDVHDRGEPLAALYASESLIYQRFGYGAAAGSRQFRIDRPYARLRQPVDLRGRLRLLDADEAVKTLPDLHRRVQPERPGMMLRPPAMWKLWLAQDPEHARDGHGERRHVVFDDRGYVVYRIKQGWTDNAPDSTLRVIELQGVDHEAVSAMWQYCFGVDLVARVEAELRPTDDPLPWMIEDSARLRVTHGEPLYLRLVDLGPALAARRYAVDGALVVDVADAFCPWNTGRWRLDGSPDGATCERTDARPDLSIDASTLAAAYLGGVRFRTLRDAGRCDEHTDGAVARADLLFASSPAPWNSMIF